jgi:hypothetical protein
MFLQIELIQKQQQNPMDHPFPEPGSRWLNTRRQEIFTVTGRTAACTDDEDDEWEILYRSDNWEPDEYRHRSLAEWYGENRHGQPRFVRVE